MVHGLPYPRILLKLSGEALSSITTAHQPHSSFQKIFEEIAQIYQLGIEIGIVVGGGNLFRGSNLPASGINRITGDQLGMLATIMNGLLMRDKFRSIAIPAQIFSALSIPGIVSGFERQQAMYALENKYIAIFVGGTGNPLVTTDTAASLRALEINASILLKATQVEGVFSADPQKNPNAFLYKTLSYQDVIEKKLGVMDLAAFCQCQEHRLPIRVFNIHQKGNLLGIIQGKDIGTLVS